MPTQQMFYEKVVPVNPQRHGNWYVDRGVDYGFARAVKLVPLMAVEIPQAAREYTIVFTDSEPAPLPIVVLALDENTNVYVTADGGWDAKYIPAFVRRYPFVFSQSEDLTKFTLCIDENWAGCNQEGRGERLFDDEGKATPYVEQVLGFLQEFQRQSQATQLYTKKLKELELLDSKQAQIKFPGGGQMSLTGFRVINREKLQALSTDVLGQRAKSGELELDYAQLQSMSNFSLMMDRLSTQRARQTLADSDIVPQEPELSDEEEAESAKATKATKTAKKKA